MTSPSASLTEAMRRPPPTFFISCSILAAGVRFLDIGDMDVAEGSGESGAVTVGDQVSFLIADFEADVVGFIAMRLDAQELAIETWLACRSLIRAKAS
jgi:hypothetical protein